LEQQKEFIMLSTILSWVGYISGILFILFLILKLLKVGKISWSWVWTALIVAVVAYLVGRYLIG